jgi:hypothetical protein
MKSDLSVVYILNLGGWGEKSKLGAGSAHAKCLGRFSGDSAESAEAPLRDDKAVDSSRQSKSNCYGTR